MTIPANGHGLVSDLVGMPPPLGPNDYRLRRPANALTWRWRWSPPGWQYEVIALDCRTARKYPAGLLDAPQLLDDGQRPPGATDTAIASDEFALQLGPKQPGDFLSLIIAQTPVFGLREMERIQETRRLKKVFDYDAEAWGLNRTGFQLMISRLAQRNPMTVLLSGDVHFSFVSVCDYWATLPFGEQQTLAPPRASRIVQLNSSALKNETAKQQVLHRSGPTALHVGPNKNPQYWVGFTAGGRVRPAGPIPSGWQPWDDYSPYLEYTSSRRRARRLLSVVHHLRWFGQPARRRLAVQSGICLGNPWWTIHIRPTADEALGPRYPVRFVARRGQRGGRPETRAGRVGTLRLRQNHHWAQSPGHS